MPSSELRKVFWMETLKAVLTCEVNESWGRFGRPSQMIRPTSVKRGMFRFDKMVRFVRVNDPSITSRSEASREGMPATFSAITSPVIRRTLGIRRVSVVPVATATLPLNVEHRARAEASPEFWIVVVAALHWAGKRIVSTTVR